MKIRIAEIHFKDPKIEKYALQKVEKLAKFHRGIQSVTVRLTSEKAHRGQNHTSFCELEFDITGKNFDIIKINDRNNIDGQKNKQDAYIFKSAHMFSNKERQQ